MIRNTNNMLDLNRNFTFWHVIMKAGVTNLYKFIIKDIVPKMQNMPDDVKFWKSVADVITASCIGLQKHLESLPITIEHSPIETVAFQISEIFLYYYKTEEFLVTIKTIFDYDKSLLPVTEEMGYEINLANKQIVFLLMTKLILQPFFDDMNRQVG